MTTTPQILASVEAADSSWWGYAHAEPASEDRRPPLDQLTPTHVALKGAVPAALIAQQIDVCGDRCPCGATTPVATVPADAVWPAGTIVTYTTLAHSAAAYADAG